MILKQEEQSKDIDSLHDQLNAIKAISDQIAQGLQDRSDPIVLVEKS